MAARAQRDRPHLRAGPRADRRRAAASAPDEVGPRALDARARGGPCRSGGRLSRLGVAPREAHRGDASHPRRIERSRVHADRLFGDGSALEVPERAKPHRPRPRDAPALARDAAGECTRRRGAPPRQRSDDPRALRAAPCTSASTRCRSAGTAICTSAGRSSPARTSSSSAPAAAAIGVSPSAAASAARSATSEA